MAPNAVRGQRITAAIVKIMILLNIVPSRLEKKPLMPYPDMLKIPAVS
jgi:hypothetical protein